MPDNHNTEHPMAGGGKTVYGASVGILMLDTISRAYPGILAMPLPGRFP